MRRYDFRLEPGIQSRALLAVQHSDGEPESRITIDHPLASVRLRITSPEVQRQDSRSQDDEHVARHACRKARYIGGRIFSAKDERTRNTSNATQPSQCSRTKRPTPLSANIVGLVRHDGRDRAVCSAHCDEHADILSPRVLDEAHDRQPNQRDETEEAHHGTSGLVLIAEPRCTVHHEPADRIRRSHHALRHGNTELELRAQDDWEEKSESVCDCSDAEEDEGESVDVPLCCRCKELLPRERLGCDVAAVGVELVDDEVNIAMSLQEAP